MNRSMKRGLTLTLLLAAGCSDSSGTGGIAATGGAAAGTGGRGSGGSGALGGSGGGGSGGATGGAGGELASGGATGRGTGGLTAGNTGGSAANTGGAAGGNSGAGGAVDSSWLTPPYVAPALLPPAGATVKVHVHAVGAQIYTCTASGGGADAGVDTAPPTYAWVLKAPDAKLFDASGVQVGTHGAGPIWTSSDGSVARGVKVIELNSPSPDAISWLLLRVSMATGPGLFEDISYVQRLSTVGGKAPAAGCDATTVGMDTPSGYTAEYYLYKGGGAGVAWLVAPTVPVAIAAPDGMKVKLHDRAIGYQIYGCLANGGADAGADGGATTYSWVFKAPEATLYDEKFVPVGLHSAGPTWKASDESVVTARELARVDAPVAGAIPWLLLKQFSTTGTGELSDIAIVQRVNTAGGKAPTTGCDATRADTQVRVAYAADYYFFAPIAAGADGGLAGN